MAMVAAICGLAASGASQSIPPHHGPPAPGTQHPDPKFTPIGPPAPVIPAQTIDASDLGAPIVLDKGWKVGITADPWAAAPGFDDSAWVLRDAKPDIEEVPEPEGPTHGRPDHVQVQNSHDAAPPAQGDHRRYAWFRLHLKLTPNHGPVALLIELPVSQSTALGVSQAGPGVDVFANGQPIKPEGPHADAPQHYQQITRLYNLNIPAGETSLTLVVRTLYIPFGYGSYTGFFADRTLRLGEPGDLEPHLALWSMNTLLERLPRVVYSVLLIVLGGFLLALFVAQKGHPEYLWLALHELVQAPIAFIELAGSNARLDSLWYAALVIQLVAISAYLFFEFLISFLSLPRRWYIRWLRYTAPLLTLLAPTLLLVGHSTAIGIVLAIVFLLSIFWMLGWLIFMFGTLIKATLRHNYEAGLLLIPLALSLVGMIEPSVVASMSSWTGHDVRSPFTIMAGPIPLHLASVADFTGILAIVLIIFGRFLRIQRDRERVTSELEAARNVQELMIPREKLATPGFEVESIYNPANEVGGDFFHVQMAADGGMLVVIGDVAGKGLKAAMNVSMLMGALRGTREHSPAKILKSLNGVLTGSESFTTCQAAWFGANGEVLLANAGHLPPYLNSQEVEVPGGLPLGVVPEVSYEEVSLYLHPGDRLLLLSDGVVEARRPSGELFGFDRVHNLSNQSVFYIADAAKAFGQEDDITVLTVRRLARTMAA